MRSRSRKNRAHLKPGELSALCNCWLFAGISHVVYSSQYWVNIQDIPRQDSVAYLHILSTHNDVSFVNRFAH